MDAILGTKTKYARHLDIQHSFSPYSVGERPRRYWFGKNANNVQYQVMAPYDLATARQVVPSVSTQGPEPFLDEIPSELPMLHQIG